MSFLKPYTTIPFVLAGLFMLSSLATLRAQNESPVPTPINKPSKVKKAAPKKTPAPSATATLVSSQVGAPSVSTAAPDAETGAPGNWSKKWMKKYVFLTSKASYVHVLLDAETVYQNLLGPSKHSAIAAEAWSLLQYYPFPADASDLVKMDIVHFKERDSYGQPEWDSIERIGHLEFSRKVLSRNSLDLLAKPESEWKSAFTVLSFYD